MDAKPLLSYLRTFRKHSGLSQSELAFLVGGLYGKNVSRHEVGDRIPALRTALKYEFVLGVAVATLYEGLCHEIRRDICHRARGLLRNLERKPKSRSRDRKIEILKRVLSKEDIELIV